MIKPWMFYDCTIMLIAAIVLGSFCMGGSYLGTHRANRQIEKELATITYTVIETRQMCFASFDRIMKSHAKRKGE